MTTVAILLAYTLTAWGAVEVQTPITVNGFDLCKEVARRLQEEAGDKSRFYCINTYQLVRQEKDT